ncbi:MAG: hypothetical protein IJ257_01800 [Treponema sp.]|nr:hypothetical protein [Treponema sp.]
MIVVLVAVFFCGLNIILWVTAFLKFKKIFSTDDIIASTREQMDNMIADINRNAGRNIEIIEDRIKQLKHVVAEADRHLENARRELENQKALSSYQQKIDSVVNERKSASAQTSLSSRAAQQYLQNKSISSGIQGANRYELTDEGSRHAHFQQVQGDLFAQADDDEKKRIVSDTGTTFTVESDGSSYASVPLIGGNVTYADEPVQPKKKFAQLVRDLSHTGYSVEEIASELGSSITEVQLVLEMDLGF